MRALTIAAVVILSSCTTVPPSSGLLTLEERFLWHAFHDDAGRSIQLRRWQDPIRAITIGGTRGERTAVAEHLEELDRIVDLGAIVDHSEDDEGNGTLAPPDGYNLLVRFGTKTDLYPYLIEARRLAGVPIYTACFAVLNPRLPDNGVVIIRRARDFAEDFADAYPEFGPMTPELERLFLAACVAQELTQLLGLPGDIDGRSDTVMASYGGATVLTSTDRVMLRILYNRRLQIGMSEAEATPIVRRIIAENGW